MIVVIALGLLNAPLATAATGARHTAARTHAGSATHARTHHKAKAPAFHTDTTPLDSNVSSSGGSNAATSVGGSGADIVRTIVGLAVVLCVIYGVYWLLKSAAKAKSGRGDERIGVVATTPLAPNRALHLVRAGEELILVGATEHSITPIRVYSGDEAVTVEAAVGETGFGLPPAPRGSAGLVETLRRWTVRQ